MRTGGIYHRLNYCVKTIEGLIDFEISAALVARLSCDAWFPMARPLRCAASLRLADKVLLK
jgi:hypothetical protein